MVPKLSRGIEVTVNSFRAVLFRMVPKLVGLQLQECVSFRAVLFRMVSKSIGLFYSFRS